MTLVVSWPEQGIPEARGELDGTAIRAAARRAVVLWPDEPVLESGRASQSSTIIAQESDEGCRSSSGNNVLRARTVDGSSLVCLAGSVWPVLCAGGQVVLCGARRRTMLERFTDQARRVVVLAEEEARILDHNWIGTEHLLLGVLREGDGVAARVLESLGISLQPVRQQVEEMIGPGQQVPAEHIPFTPRSKKVLELSLRESQQLGHDRVGTGHILLGLIREGDGVAAQVLVRLGADLNQVRQQVIELVGDLGPQSGRRSPREVVPVIWMHARLDVFGGRLAAVEQRVGIGPDTSDLDKQIARIRREKESAIDARDYAQAAALRDREKELRASKAARHEQWAAALPALPDLAERVQQLADEVERLRAVLRQYGIDPQDKPA